MYELTICICNLAEELEALSRETEELKQIKAAMGTHAYTQKVFDKVFTSDIERLLSMDSMWEHREKPTALFFNDIEKEVDDKSKDVTESGLRDQRVWSLKECLDMFKDRYNMEKRRAFIYLLCGKQRE